MLPTPCSQLAGAGVGAGVESYAYQTRVGEGKYSGAPQDYLVSEAEIRSFLEMPYDQGCSTAEVEAYHGFLENIYPSESLL